MLATAAKIRRSSIQDGPPAFRDGEIVAAQPYYFVGQWRLPTGRLVRAFLCSTRGTLHIARVAADPNDLTAEELDDCCSRLFPDLLCRLQRFSREIPGVLKRLPVALAPEFSPADRGRTSQMLDSIQTADLRPGSSPARRLGELLVHEMVITAAQLEVALRLQAVSHTYVPLGQVLLAQRFITRKKLDAMLQRHGKRARLGEILLRAGRITTAQLAEAIVYQRRMSMPIGQALVRLGWVSETAMRDALCTQLHINFLDLDAIVIDKDLARLVSERFARWHSLVPVFRVDNVLVIAMDDPSQAAIVARLESTLGLQIETVTTTTERLGAALHRLYGLPLPPDGPVVSGCNILIGPVRDHVVAELIVSGLRGAGVVRSSSQ